MIMTEQVCDNCQKPNPKSEMYCFSCGHILPAGREKIGTNALPDKELKPQLRWGTAYFGDESLLRIRVRDVNALVEVVFDGDLVLGRAVGDVTPDVDLTPYEAQELGVSRRHVKLTRESATVMVQDLGSANGTFLNGQKLVPYQPRVLRNEDELVLGGLAVRVSFSRSPRGSETISQKPPTDPKPPTGLD